MSGSIISRIKRYRLQISIFTLFVIISLLVLIQVIPAEGLTGSRVYISEYNSDIIISSGGSYILSGSSDEACITVDAGNDANVNLILNGIDISNSESAPVYIISASEVTITLVDGTDNYINDNRESDSDEEVTAAVFSKADLCIEGNGSLIINAHMNDAIKSKDNLVINGGSISVNSVDDGIIGRDSLEINGGGIYINASGDALKTTNDEDSGSGLFILNDGVIDAVAGDEGIDSVYSVEINGGSITINAADEGIEAQYVTVNDGTVNITAADDGINIAKESDSSASGALEMPQMQMDFSSVSADFAPTMSSNSMNAAPGGGMGRRGGRPGGGDHGGGRPAGGMGGGMGSPGGGMGGEFETIDGSLTINGGNITVNAYGDGLDSNGNIYITGGYTYVSGSTNGGNAALDYNGECVMTGGVLILSGVSGMAQNISDDSSMTMLTATSDESLEEGDTVTITDEDGNILYSFEIAKTCSYLQAAVPEFSSEGSYSFNIEGGESYEAVLSSHTGF